MRTIASLVVLTALGATTACAPADVAGSYTVALTNRENSCGTTGFAVGDRAEGVMFTVTQNGGMVTGEVGGLAGLGIAAAFGSNRFSGDVAGNSVAMTMNNPRAGSQGSCAFTWDVRINGSLAGNALQGTVTYRPMTNNHPDCASLRDCRILQEFSGSRPPR